MLDAEEYLHLAINATQQAQHHVALEYLHKCLAIEPNNARASLLLAAEHAELGLYNKAIEGMQRSLKLAPEMEIARYQLALLYMQQGLMSESHEIWKFFSEQANDIAIKLFAQGMLAIDKDHNRGLDLIKQASEANTSNNFLNKSIVGILENLKSNLHSSATEEPEEPQSLHAIYLNAYNDSEFTKDES